MVQYNPVLLNRFLAPGIAEFSVADIPDLRATNPEAEHWMSNHFLNNIFRDTFTGRTRQYVINLLCRAQAQFSQYHQARDTTLHYLAQSGLHSPVPKLYFTAIVQWEMCILNYQIFVDVFRKMTRTNIFQQNDGSEEQRAYEMGNAIKHWGSSIKAGHHHDDDTLPMWLINSGFRTRSLSLTYSELGAITSEVAKTANELQDIRSFKAT